MTKETIPLVTTASPLYVPDLNPPVPDLVAAVQHDVPPPVVDGTDVVLSEVPTAAPGFQPRSSNVAGRLLDHAEDFLAATDGTTDHEVSVVRAKLSEVVAFLKS